MPRPSLTLRLIQSAKDAGLTKVSSLASHLETSASTVNRRLQGRIAEDAVVSAAVEMMDDAERCELVRLFAEEVGAPCQVIERPQGACVVLVLPLAAGVALAAQVHEQTRRAA